MEQYKRDRDPRERLFNFGRCVVHFAVDDSEVQMCTQLKGKASWFLPFNKGKLADWSCKKTTSAGDLFLFYFGKPALQIASVGIAIGEVFELENSDWDWTANPRGWFCDFKSMVKLDTPLTMAEIKAHPVLKSWWKGLPYKGQQENIR